MSVSRKQIKAERRQRRQMVEQTRVAVESKQQRGRWLLFGGAALALLLLIGLFAYLAGRQPNNVSNIDQSRVAPDTTSQGFTDQGNRHINPAEVGRVSYNSTPPTSGPHLSNLAPGGWHDEPVVKELVVHNLEDGYVAVWYRPNLDQAQKDRLRALVEEYGDKVIAAPYEGLDVPIALTAWTRLDKLPALDEDRIRNFVKAYRGTDHHKR